MRGLAWHVMVATVTLVTVAAGCGSGDDDSAGSADNAGETTQCATEGTVDEDADSQVEVDLGEWSISVGSAPAAGNVEITANNRGAEPHELVIVRADSPDELTVVDGKVDEDAQPEGSFIGEIEEFASLGSCSGTFALQAGNYVFFCNIVEEEDDGELESHFEEGMVTTVAVG